MLNNDFSVLVKKYKHYKIQESKKRNRRILLLIMIAAIAYYISSLYHSKPAKQLDSNETKKVILEHNATIPKDESNESKKEAPIHIEKPTKEVHDKVSKTKTTRLKVTTQGETLKQLLENQAKSQSYSSTIAIANYHYSKKNYPETIKWAIEASKKNKSKVRPWILYAKCKNAQGKKEIAKKAFTLFLKRHKSKEVQELLNTL